MHIFFQHGVWVVCAFALVVLFLVQLYVMLSSAYQIYQICTKDI